MLCKGQHLIAPALRLFGVNWVSGLRVPSWEVPQPLGLAPLHLRKLDSTAKSYQQALLRQYSLCIFIQSLGNKWVLCREVKL